MSAEVLRQAAALMRARAESWSEDAEFINRWTAKPTIDPDNMGWVVAHDWEADYDSTVAHLPYDYEGQVAAHVAAWHPVVALAVADWLDRSSRLLADGRSCNGPEVEHALAVARAYLGSP